MTIEDWRRQMDEIDRKLVKLLNERSQCAIEIGQLKKTLEMRIFDPEREREVLRNVRAANSGPLDGDGLTRLFERIIDECRRIERLSSQKEE